MSMNGKVCIVTGANVGIGLETAKGLAKQGAEVILAVRDAKKGETAKAEIAAAAPGAKLHVMTIDLASQRSIRDFVQDFESRFSRLDVLVNNAGLVPGQRALTADGLELQFGVNHLGPYLLTRLLLPRLQAAAPSRIVVVSSSVHRRTKLDFDDLQGEKSYSTMGTYAKSKLANMMFVHALAKRLQGTGVTVNGLHPGVVATQLAREMPGPFRLLAKLFFTTPEKGARTSLYLATSPDVAGTSGKYFESSKQVAADPAAHDDATTERLWIVSASLVGLPA